MKRVILGLLVVLSVSVMTSCKKTDTTVDADKVAYDAADGILGGKLYDKFWAAETGWSAPAGITATDISNYGNFYRCKNCHGLDLMGKTGAYAGRAPKISRPSCGVDLTEPRANDDYKELFGHIYDTDGRKVDAAKTADGTDPSLGGDEMPAFATILTKEEAWDIVKFIKEESVDVSKLYDTKVTGTYPNGVVTFENIGKDGDAAAGDTYFAANCASCHGANGLGADDFIVDDGDTVGVGNFGRNEPYSVQHRVKFGNPGTDMPVFSKITVTELKNLLAALQDETKYPTKK